MTQHTSAFHPAENYIRLASDDQPADMVKSAMSSRRLGPFLCAFCFLFYAAFKGLTHIGYIPPYFILLISYVYSSASIISQGAKTHTMFLNRIRIFGLINSDPIANRFSSWCLFISITSFLISMIIAAITPFQYLFKKTTEFITDLLLFALVLSSTFTDIYFWWKQGGATWWTHLYCQGPAPAGDPLMIPEAMLGFYAMVLIMQYRMACDAYLVANGNLSYPSGTSNASQIITNDAPSIGLLILALRIVITLSNQANKLKKIVALGLLPYAIIFTCAFVADIPWVTQYAIFCLSVFCEVVYLLMGDEPYNMSQLAEALSITPRAITHSPEDPRAVEGGPNDPTTQAFVTSGLGVPFGDDDDGDDDGDSFSHDSP